MIPIPILPPGLRQLQEQEKLTEQQMRQLSDAWYTIRGQRPRTLAEWSFLWSTIKRVVEAEEEED